MGHLVGERMGIGLQSGRSWDSFQIASRDPGGRAPPTQPPGPQLLLSSMRAKSLDLPRHLRTRARREEPADSARQVPGIFRRRRGAGGLPGDRAGRTAGHRDVDAPGLRGVLRTGPREAQSDVSALPGPESRAVRQLTRPGARLRQASDDPRRPEGVRVAGQGGRGDRRRQLPGDLGSRRAPGLQRGRTGALLRDGGEL